MSPSQRLTESLASTPLSSLPARALRQAFAAGYGAKEARRDVLAGLVVGVVALPLAMALAIAVGAPPQLGLYTSIVGGFIIAVLGGSSTQVSGPTAAFIVILAPITAKYGVGGLLIAGLLGGVQLTLMGVLRFGRFIQYIPHPVTTGFTAGIGLVIATLQLQDVFGLHLHSKPQHYVERVAAMIEARSTASMWELGIATLTLAILLLIPRITRKVPAPLVALPVAAIAALALGRWVPGTTISTIGTRFQTELNGLIIHGIPQLPPLPVLPWSMPGADGHPVGLSWDLLHDLVPGSFAIAMLGAIESLLSAVVADGMARTRHEPDAELIAQGIGNIIVPFFGGIPATGAIARTATNIRSGAKSPVAAMVHALTVLAAVLVLAPLLAYVPMASLAALLLLVAWNMSEIKHFIHILKIAPKSDVTVLLTCFFLTVAFDMVVAVSVGVMLAAVLFMRRMAEVTHAEIRDSHEGLPRRPGEGVLVYDIAGPLFFGAAQKAMAALGIIADRARAVVLRMDQVPALDATGLVAFESALEELANHGCLTVVTGLQPQPRKVFDKSGIVNVPGKLILAQTLEEALDAADAHATATRLPPRRSSRTTAQQRPAAQ